MSAPSPGSSTHLGIELSALAGARIGDGQTSVGLGAVSFLDVSGWLVGFEGRVDRYRRVPDDHSGGALELALLGGRRFRFQNLSLDVVVGPAAALQGTTTFSSTVTRLLLASRLNFPAHSSWRTFVGLDGEVGPTRAGDADLPGAPRLPLWTLGLALGATVGTR